MIYAMQILQQYREVYSHIMGFLFPDKLVYAKMYESLIVHKQFFPVVYYDKGVLDAHPDLQEDNKILINSIYKQREVLGTKIVVTNDRIPKVGLTTIDKRQFDLNEVEYTAETILNTLFYSKSVVMGVIPTNSKP